MTSIEHSEHCALAKRIAARFKRPWHRDYARNKLRFDPAYAAVAALLANATQPLLDIGCGLGLLGFYLRERGFSNEYRGLDFDAGKIIAAREAAHACDARLTFEESDVRGLPAFSGHVALLDVLHYLPADAQQRLLHESAARVAPGAALIIRNALHQSGWRYRITVIEEFFLHASRWMRTRAVHFPRREEIETPLRASGFVVDVRPLWGNTPFSSFVIVARRAGECVAD